MDTPISHVMDTAFWVAQYRADESLRKDALFKDPLAAKLTEELGAQISQRMSASKMVRWTVVTRTVIIDQLIEQLISEGVDAVLNLGAGLDTRPYRMKLPSRLRWIEVDFPKTINFKNAKLAADRPVCQLERIAVDLSDREQRRALLKRVQAMGQKVLVLTEGVVPYLSEQNVCELGEDLREQTHFNYWIAEYLSPNLYPYFKSRRRQREMRHAPFIFMPPDWFRFFENCGWKVKTIKYSGEESERIRRPIPMPWYLYPLKLITPKKHWLAARKMSGFMLLEPK